MDSQTMANMSDMNAIAGSHSILQQSRVKPTKQAPIESLPRTDQSFIIAFNTEAAPILLEEYMASIFRATIEHQLQNGGVTTLNVGLPNAHDFLPDLAEELPILAAQAKYMGANNQYQSPYASDIMGIGAGTENTSYLVNQNASFPMFNHYLYHQGPAVENEAYLHDASGSGLSFGLAQDHFGQVPYNHTSFTEMLLLQHAKPTMHSPQPGIHEETNPPLAYADGNPTGLIEQLYDPSRVEYPSEEDLEGLTPIENGFGYMPTIQKDGLYPRIPYIDHKYEQAKKAQVLLQNQTMNPDTRIADARVANSFLSNTLTALDEKGQEKGTLNARGLYERGEPSVPRGATIIEQANARVDGKLLSPNIPPESLVLHQGQSNVLPRVTELPGFESLYDPRYERMGRPCDPHIRLLLARHHGTSGYGDSLNRIH